MPMAFLCKLYKVAKWASWVMGRNVFLCMGGFRLVSTLKYYKDIIFSSKIRHMSFDQFCLLQ